VAAADHDHVLLIHVVRRSSFDVRRAGFDVRRSAHGTDCEYVLQMVAKRYEDLEAWQIADELKREVYALTKTGGAAKDFKFHQIRDSAASNTKNIAEGFGRFRPAPFAQFMEFAVSSAMETKDSSKDGVDRGYFTHERVAGALKLAERSIQCSTKLIVYLKGRSKGK